MDDARKEYGDIIDREHPVSEKHPPMPRNKRAAQFAPFAALSGYDDLIREAARETDRRTEPGEDALAELDRKLNWLFRQSDPPEASFTVFIPDGQKAGGAYQTVRGRPLRYDRHTESITLSGGETLFIDDLRAIDCEAFSAEFPEG